MFIRSLCATSLALVLVSCGGGGGGDGGPEPVLEVVKWTPSGDNQVDTVGQLLPKVVRVKVTLDGEVAAGFTVNFAGGLTDGILGTASMVTGADGIATSSWTLPNTVGTRVVTATVVGAIGSPLTFTATGVADAPFALEMVSGDDQVTEVDAFFSSQLLVRVVDQFSNPIADRWIQWSKTGPVTLSADSVITGANGVSNQVVRAADTTGAATVTATAVGLSGSPIEFSSTIVGGVPVVVVASNSFSPANVTIAAGAAVQWNWASGNHSVTSDGSPSFTGSSVEVSPFILGPVIFATPGVYSYHCSVHASMTGTVTVN